MRAVRPKSERDIRTAGVARRHGDAAGREPRPAPPLRTIAPVIPRCTAVRADEAGHRDVNHDFADQLGRKPRAQTA